jgi:NitT/TauT family transport system substrate-binding protein
MADWRINNRRVSRDLVVAFAATLGLVALSIAFGGQPKVATSGKPALNIAYFPNLTHAPALIGVAQGTFQRSVPGFSVQPRVVNAGPEAMEALLAGEVDIAYVGPSPAINTYLKSHGTALKILAGACSGGACLVSRGDETISSVAGLDHKRVAVPQLGGTQDVSLRHFLDLNGLAPEEKGGSVSILPVKNPDILALFLQKQIDAAWVPEPWASRLEKDAKATIVADESDLWPGKTFTTTVIVVRSSFEKLHPEAVKAVLSAHLQTIDWIRDHNAEAQTVVNAELKRLTGKALGETVLHKAWNRLRFSADPNPSSILALAEAAHQAGYLKEAVNLNGAFDGVLLAEAEQQRRRETR